VKVLRIADDRFVDTEDCSTVIVDLSNVKDVEDYFGVFADCVFPNYFGYNWNAFDECIQDLSWYKNKNVIFRLKTFERILLMHKSDTLYAIEAISSASKQKWDHHPCFLMEINDKYFKEIEALFNSNGGNYRLH